MKRPLAVLATAALALGAVAACGEKDEPETTGSVVTTATEETTTTTQPTTTEETTKELTPEGAVEAFLVSSDATLVCDTLITDRFLRASYGDRQGCIAARKPASLAQSAQLSPEPDGVVTARPVGGVYDGDVLAFTTVPAAGGVAIDSVKSNAPVGP